MMSDEHVVKMYNELHELNKALRQKYRLIKKVDRVINRVHAAKDALVKAQSELELAIDVYVTLRTKVDREYGRN